MNRTKLDDWLLKLPGVAAAPKWGDDWVYTVAEKMFCVLCVNGPDAGRMSFKVEADLFLAMLDHPGIEPAPYLARAKWVLLRKPGDFDAKWLRSQVEHAYELVRNKLPRRVREAL